MPALADRLFSWTVPIEGVEGREGGVRDGCENCSQVGDGGRVSREEQQFQHVVQANLLFPLILTLQLCLSLHSHLVVSYQLSCNACLRRQLDCRLSGLGHSLNADAAQRFSLASFTSYTPKRWSKSV